MNWQDVRKHDLFAVYALIGLAALFLITFTIIASPYIFSIAGFGVFLLILTGLFIGFALGYFLFNESMKLKLMNTLNKKANYHVVRLRGSGHRCKTYVKEVRNDPTIDIDGRHFTLDSKEVWIENNVPSIEYNENDTLPLKLDLANIDPKRDPVIIGNAFVKMQELAREKAAKAHKQLMLLVYILLAISAFGLLAGALTYFKVDELAKNFAQTILQAAKK